MAKAASDLQWRNIDIETLSPDMQEAYKSYKAAYAEAMRIREGFEHMIADAVKIPAGKRVVFGYRFGKLSLAIADDDTKPKAPSKAASLADLIRR